MSRFCIVTILALAPLLLAAQTNSPDGRANIPATPTVPLFKKLPKEAEQQLRVLRGVVRDAKENAVAGALVMLKDKKTDKVRTNVSQDDGTYLFDRLDRKIDYEVVAQLEGMKSRTRLLSVYNNTSRPYMELKLELKEEPKQESKQESK